MYSDEINKLSKKTGAIIKAIVAPTIKNQVTNEEIIWYFS